MDPFKYGRSVVARAARAQGSHGAVEHGGVAVDDLGALFRRDAVVAV